MCMIAKLQKKTLVICLLLLDISNKNCTFVKKGVLKMRVFKILTTIVLFLLPNLFFAQTVSATFFDLPQQKVYLNAYTGLYMEVVDSVMMNHEKRAEFNTTLTKGMYQIETEYGQSVDFLYDNSSVIMIVKDIDDISSIEFLNSQPNTDWVAYMIYKEQIVNSLNLLKPVLREYDKNTDFYINAKKEYQSLQENFISYTDSLIQHDNYASNLIRADRFPSLNLDDDFKKQRNDMIYNFFNDVDFNNLSLIPTEVLTNKIIDFLSIQITADQSQEQQIMSLILASDNVLRKTTVNFEMYKFVFQFLMESFNELKINDVVDYLTRIPYYEEMNCTDEQYEELVLIAESNSRARIGTYAKNISGKTVTGENFDLYSIENDFIIVYFWSYTCDHCRESLKKLESFLNENTNFSLLAVSVKGELKKIKNLAKKYKAEACFYHDGLEWDSPAVNDYGVTATPSFYLLNSDKVIVYKPFDYDELINFIDLMIKP